ncbi:ZNF41 protein, partial [Sterrhoptilus dennistouni]|nr:ZNF41 protein [Sterrhoptilus dennistouni]
ERPMLGQGGGQRCNHSLEMRVHEQLHNGKKYHKCSKCDKSFSKRCSLIRHFIIHLGEWPYECGECGKGFRSNSELVIHHRSH